MSQPNIDTQFYQYDLVRDVIRRVAEQQSADEVLPVILRMGCEALGASAAFSLLFEDPRLIHTYGGVTSDALPDDATIQESIHATQNSTSSWVYLPVFDAKHRACGALGFWFDTAGDTHSMSESYLTTLQQCAAIVFNAEMKTYRHQKLIYNQNEFVRIVSHDLRSPLTSIKGFASMLLEASEVGDLNERQMYFVHKILSGVSQMASLVENIQDAGRYDPETGFYEMERGPTDLIDIVKRIVEGHLVPAEKQNLTLTMVADDDVPILNVDDTMLERAIINLVDNAIKYTPDDGQVEVAVRRVGHQVRITITDNGYGIGSENLARLFQKHFRIHRREHKRVKGSGLGLFIVRSVAIHHGGDAWVESVEGEGSTFGIYLPLSGANLLGASTPPDTT